MKIDFTRDRSSHEQILLLKAILSDERIIIPHWENWSNAVDVRFLDNESSSLMSLLYSKLNKIGMMSNKLNIPRGAYKKAKIQNQLYLHFAAEIVRVLQTAKIPNLLFKDVTILLNYYKNYGLRPIHNLRFLVERDKAIEASKLLITLGWVPIGFSNYNEFLAPENAQQCTSYNFKNKYNQCVSLHWYPLMTIGDNQSPKVFWQNPITIQFEGVEALTISPTCELLLVCVDGIRWNDSPPIRWIVDALTILSHCPEEIDWAKILAFTERKELILPLLMSLERLKQEYHAPVPDEVIKQLKSSHTPFLTKVKFYHEISDQDLLINLMLGCIYDFNNIHKNAALVNKIIIFPRFFKQYFQINSLWNIPFFTIKKLIRRFLGLNHTAIKKRLIN